MSNSNLSDIGINLKYTKGLPLDYFGPSSYAMAWCMMATGVYRIFNRNDMNEFLFRLPITLNSLGLVETWLMKDHLMGYRVKNKDYTLTLNEVSMHFGLEIADVIENKSSREQFLDRISAGITGSMIMGEFGGFSVIEPEINEDDTKTFSGQKSTPAITPELISKAEFFAADLMKFIPDETFTEPNPLIVEKDIEIRFRKARISTLPVFDINQIPRRMLKRCLEIIYAPEYVDKLLSDPEKLDREARPMIYLAWLLDNDLLVKNGPFTSPVEGVQFNFNEYSEDGGYNLEDTIETYNLEEVAAELKGVLNRGQNSHIDGIWSGDLLDHPLFKKHNITSEEIVSLNHLYHSGIDMKNPYYGGDRNKIYIEIGFRNNHNGSLTLFDRIFLLYGFSTPCGLARLFHFNTEAHYHAFMEDIAELMLMGFYSRELSQIESKKG